MNMNATDASFPLGLWSTLEIVPNDTATFTLHDLEENCFYEFCIQSRLLRNSIVLNSETVSAQTKSKLDIQYKNSATRGKFFAPVPSPGKGGGLT